MVLLGHAWGWTWDWTWGSINHFFLVSLWHIAVFFFFHFEVFLDIFLTNEVVPYLEGWGFGVCTIDMDGMIERWMHGGMIPLEQRIEEV